ncbi:MAG: gliding motility-associated C-terminal domain-containing protein [Bacteroidota bacterium]
MLSQLTSLRGLWIAVLFGSFSLSAQANTGTPPDSLPNARPDTLLDAFQASLIYNVLENDLFDVIDTLYLLELPQYGMANLSILGDLIYAPGDASCYGNWMDALSYVLCGRTDCDTARVFVELSCATILVYDGFSPNGDGINDHFVIEGLEQFIQHRLLVYNRWGTLVFESKDYQNDWTGSWKGKALPSGTYYYILEYGVDAMIQGRIEIRR